MRASAPLVLAVFLVCGTAGASTLYHDVLVPTADPPVRPKVAIADGRAVVAWMDFKATGTYTASAATNGGIIGPTRIGPPSWPVLASNGHDVIAAWSVEWRLSVVALDANGQPLLGRALETYSPDGVRGIAIASAGDRFLISWFGLAYPAVLHWLVVDRNANPVSPVQSFSSERLIAADEAPVAGVGDRFAILYGWYLGLESVTKALFADRSGNVIGDPTDVAAYGWSAISAETDHFVIVSDDGKFVSMRTLMPDGGLGIPLALVSHDLNGPSGAMLAFDGSARVLGLRSSCPFCYTPFYDVSRIAPSGTTLETLPGLPCDRICDSLSIATGDAAIVMTRPAGANLRIRFFELGAGRLRAVRR